MVMSWAGTEIIALPSTAELFASSGDPVMLPSGIYIVSVFDDRGCSTDTTYIIMEPSAYPGLNWP